MKKVLCWLMILFIGVACQEEEKVQNIEEPKEEMKEVKMAVLNVCDDTEDADILLLCDDGSYILCDAENHEGYGLLYMNESINNDFENGFTVILDENGIPVMASCSEGQFVFKNVTGNSFDFAFIDRNNEISYYYDIKFDSQSRSMLRTRSIIDPWIDSWKTLRSGGWDEHKKKAIVPFLYKIVSFAITVGDAYWGTGQLGLAHTFFFELYKSGDYKNEWLDDFFFGTGMTSLSLSGFDLKKLLNNGSLDFSRLEFGLSYLAYLLNEYGDKQLEKLGQIDEWVGPHFDTEEWKISLSPNLLECDPDDYWYFVDVSSKAAWGIDTTQIDHNWCEVKKLDVQVAVHVKPNTSENDRTCNLVVYAEHSSEISPVSLTIKQSGIVFELSEEKLSFTQNGGSKGVYITTNENIKSWEVTSYPSWCKINNEGKFSFFVDVDESEETRNGIITVTALTKGGISVDRCLNIEQKVIPLCPDNNHPHAIDLGIGIKFACCNVGASSPTHFGNYYEWKESKTAVANWGNGWRMPNMSQLRLLENCSHEWKTINGINGMIFKGKNGNRVFLPAAGIRLYDGVKYAGVEGHYWSSEVAPGTDEGGGLFISFDIKGIREGYGYCYGYSLRPIAR